MNIKYRRYKTSYCDNSLFFYVYCCLFANPEGQRLSKKNNYMLGNMIVFKLL